MPEPTVTLTLRLDPGLYAYAKARARTENISLNAWIQRAAEHELELDMRLDGESWLQAATRQHEELAKPQAPARQG